MSSYPDSDHEEPQELEEGLFRVETRAGRKHRVVPPEPKRERMLSPQLLLEHRQGASNRTPRQINRDLIFNQIRINQPISRADLARYSGLQRSTISYIVEELLAKTG